ncbi:MAG TPA: response regulator, partial [Planctomycetota bacterium]|nr:response regulator [Planctomycetota bacterium]
MTATRLVLCIDDDPPVLAAVRRLLRNEPYEVVTTEDPEEVLRLVESREVALIIADQRMPRILGTDLLKVVRQKSPETACIILTGHADLSDIAGAMNDGAVDRLIRKPWDDGDFRKMIRQLLERRPEEETEVEAREARPERPLLRIRCEHRSVPEVLADLSSSLEGQGMEDTGVVLVFEGLLRVAGSLSNLLRE